MRAFHRGACRVLHQLGFSVRGSAGRSRSANAIGRPESGRRQPDFGRRGQIKSLCPDFRRGRRCQRWPRCIHSKWIASGRGDPRRLVCRGRARLVWHRRGRRGLDAAARRRRVWCERGRVHLSTVDDSVVDECGHQLQLRMATSFYGNVCIWWQSAVSRSRPRCHDEATSILYNLEVT